MQPDQQIEQLKALLEEVNKKNATKDEVVELFGVFEEALKTIRTDLEKKGNATKDEVVALFGVFEKALKKIRADLEAKIANSSTSATKNYQELLTSLRAVESSLRDSVVKTDSASKESVEALRTEFRGKLEVVRKAIPKPPTKYTAGRNIEINNGEITNTNPKITVSREKPSNPQLHDLWLRLDR